MFCTQNFQVINKLSQTQLRKFSKHIVPVRLSYASYESTAAPTNKDPLPLIINHGIFGSKSNWNSLCKVFHNKTKRKIIATDARNHGDSPHSENHSYDHLATDLKKMMFDFKLRKVALLGHSMGGRTVMYFALKYPDLVEKLIVVDISPVARIADMKTISNLFHVLQNLTLPKNVTMSTARIQTDLQLTRFVREKNLRNFLLTNLIQNADGSYNWRINVPALLANFRDIAGFPPTNNAQFPGPVLFLGSRDSKLIQKSDHPKIKQLFPKAEFKYMQSAGHWIHCEKPRSFLEFSIRFLNKE